MVELAATAELAPAQEFLGGRVVLRPGDCRDVLKSMPDASVDSVCTDPPYALVSISKRFGKDGAAPAKFGTDGAYARASAGFMGKQWDTGETAFAVEFWAEVYRVLKPGGHVVAFSGTRTYHRMTCAIEDAGFEIRDQLAWCYGSGFPKSHNVSKAIDKLDAKDAKRDQQLRFTEWMRGTGISSSAIDSITNTNMGGHYLTDKEQPSIATRDHFEKLRPHLVGVVVPAWVESLVDQRTVESENFKAREIVGQHKHKAQAAEWRASIQGGSVADAGAITLPHTPEAATWDGWGTALKPAWEPICLGRKPLVGTVAENVLDHGTGALNIDGCRVGSEGGTAFGRSADKSETDSVGGYLNAQAGAPIDAGRWPANIVHDGSDEVLAAFPDSQSSRSEVTSKPGAVNGAGAGLPSHTGIYGFDDSGSAARFFYSAKADKLDRIGSKHPTVKPVDLMQWLCRLITPPGGTVLDPFAGSGSTGEAAWREGFRCILVEREAEYQADIAERLRLADKGPRERRQKAIKQVADAGPLFGANDNEPTGGGDRSTESSRTSSRGTSPPPQGKYNGHKSKFYVGPAEPSVQSVSGGE